MSKSILAIDTPERCSMCKFIRSTDEQYHYCRILGFDYQVDDYMQSTPKGKPDWCPLRDLPGKTSVGIEVCIGNKTECVKSYVDGYNACIDEILKGVNVDE